MVLTTNKNRLVSNFYPETFFFHLESDEQNPDVEWTVNTNTDIDMNIFWSENCFWFLSRNHAARNRIELLLVRLIADCNTATHTQNACDQHRYIETKETENKKKISEDLATRNGRKRDGLQRSFFNVLKAIPYGRCYKWASFRKIRLKIFL